ncbi:MAG: hypothetical protein IPK62_14240 [Bacteroidetes bacterium]|nr:hypothetical protein [Bacteroidota bacterium]
MTSTLKTFRKNYGAYLLPISANNYSIGDLWDRVGISGRLKPENTNIAYVCDNPVLAEKLRVIENVDANLPDLDITSDFNQEANINIPSLNVSIEESLQISKVERMIFKSVTTKNTHGGLLEEMYDHVTKLRKDDIQKYRNRVKHSLVTIAYYYAEKVQIEVEKEVMNKDEYNLKIAQTFGLDVGVSFGSYNKVFIEINNSKCPFAAQFIHGRNLKH